MVLLYILIGMALVFDFLNGFHDSSNIVATIIFSRAMSPRKALLMTAVAEFSGPFLFGVAVAKTIGEGIVLPSSVDMWVLVAALFAAIFWNLFTWYFGIPSSSSHALIGGLVGAVIVSVGFHAIEIGGLIKVAIALFASPILGLIVAFLITRLVFFLARNATMRVNKFFKRAQVLTGLSLALSHGANDAQKTMGIITMGLVISGVLPDFNVPLWVIAVSAGAIAIGTSVGGWRLIKTLGGRFYKIRPVHGFTAQISSASIILGAALLGGPVSTTQVVSSSILGAGSAERVNMVRWGVAGNILMAWVFTIPITILLSGGTYWLLQYFFH
ncbi:MAG: anion permease [Anaerolineaceae bacterium]|nr:anion permease [Anaerolineaceae bacterium]